MKELIKFTIELERTSINNSITAGIADQGAKNVLDAIKTATMRNNDNYTFIKAYATIIPIEGRTVSL